MTEDHLQAIIAAAEGKKDGEGWWTLQEGRHLTLYVSSAASSLTVSRVEALRQKGPLVEARSQRGDVYVLALEDVFAGQVEPLARGTRRAGFG